MKSSPRTKDKAIPELTRQGGLGIANDNLAIRLLREHWDLLAVLTAVSLIYSALPLGTAIRFGGDEGYELMKGFLVSKGYKLYQQIWCDQTPLFPMLLSWAFRIWGPSLLAARLIAAAFGLLLFGTFLQLVRQTAGRLPAFLATFLLVASPIVLELSVSVMQEVPAFAIGLLSVLLLFRWQRTHHSQWLIASGVLMGIALGIKVTAALLVPAVLAEIMFLQPQGKSFAFKKTTKSAFGWLIAMGFSFGTILFLWGSGSIHSTWQTQSVAKPIGGMERPEDFPLSVPLLLSHGECVMAAIVGLFLIFLHRRPRDFVFPMILFFTTFAVHSIHRPFWDYYYLHLAIPVAWIAGVAIAEFVSRIIQHQAGRMTVNWQPNPVFKTLIYALFIAFVLVRSERRLETQITDLRKRDRTNTSKLLAEVKKYAGQAHWIYTQEGMTQYAFESGLPMPPQIAVVSLKRFWSGQINTETIIRTCQQYKPELLLFSSDPKSNGWRTFCKDYTNALHERTFFLYIRKQ